ncbi:MAG: ATP-binding protein [Promethearchaeota archaeon]
MTDDVYRQLQEHLNKTPTGFPPTESGVEISLLKRLFTPEEAEIAKMLKFSWMNLEPLETIYERVKHLGYSLEELEQHLDNMAKKGGIAYFKKGKTKNYGNAMLLIGMYEFQVNKLTKGFINDMKQYIQEAWGREAAKVPVSQLRTIPVGISIKHDMNITNYDDVKTIMDNIEEPIVVTNCVCRQEKDLFEDPCKMTSRREVCIGYGGIARMYIDLGWGRQITKQEALEILKNNEKDGLIFQPGNAQKPDFICSCCACCCLGLAGLKRHPTPADLITSNYFAEIDSDSCTGCETCIDICQMDAISLEGSISVVNRKRCIGCRNCMLACPSDAITMHKKSKQHVPPLTGEELYDKMSKMRKKVI